MAADDIDNDSDVDNHTRRSSTSSTSQRTDPHPPGYVERRMRELEHTTALTTAAQDYDPSPPQAAAPHAAAISSTSSTASTASAPSTTTNAGTSTNTGRGKGKAKARTSYTGGRRLSIQDVHAAVRWWQHESEQDGQPGGELRDILFDLHFDPRPNQEAFFKLHTKVRLKAVRNSKVSMYLWIPPERIQSLAFTDDDDDDDDHDDGITLTTARLPNTSSVGLVFKLHEPAVLIGPNVSLTPSSKADGSVLDSLRVLAQGTRLAVYLPRRQAPNKDQLQSLCRAILPGSARLTSMSQHADLASLYGGKGGKVILGAWDDVAPTRGASLSSTPTSSSSRQTKLAPPLAPPAYDHLRLSLPPPFPLQPPALSPRGTTKGIRGTGISSAAQHDPAPSNKRRRRGSDPGFFVYGDHTGLESKLHEQLRAELRAELKDELCAELRAELKDELRAELRAELLDELRTELRTEMKTQLNQVWSECKEDQGRLRSWVEDEFSSNKDELDDWAADLAARELDVAKGELKTFIDDRLDAIEVRVEDDLKIYVQDALTSASLTFEFG